MKIFKLLFALFIALSMTACSLTIPKAMANDLMKDIPAKTVTGKAADDKFTHNTADFSVELFKKTIDEKRNSLVSPLSVMLALSMTANGADNETLKQMEKVLGNDISLEELNQYLYSYAKSLPSEKKSRLNIANSIWFNNDGNSLAVEKDFLQKNADFYNASIFKSAFDDKTLQDINKWVKTNTDGMIDKILDKIDQSTVMYLINAIAFEAEWKTVYDKEDVTKGDFTGADGIKRAAYFMSSEEQLYLDDGKATGFIKPYFNDKYRFVALLPNEGISIGDYIKTITGESFLNTVNNATKGAVSASMPKFKYEYTIKMNDDLKELGMPDAFSEENADFQKLGKSPEGNIFIGEVLHKTFISVDELGTKAGAVTKVEMRTTSVSETKSVRLDRPFVYAIIESSTNLPVFIGTVMDP